METKKVKIQENEYYTMQDVVLGRFFPWATSFWSVRKIVTSDLKHQNILKPIITGKKRGTKYQFKGINIIKFITEVEAGNVRL